MEPLDVAQRIRMALANTTGQLRQGEVLRQQGAPVSQIRTQYVAALTRLREEIFILLVELDSGPVTEESDTRGPSVMQPNPPPNRSMYQPGGSMMNHTLDGAAPIPTGGIERYPVTTTAIQVEDDQDDAFIPIY